MDEDEARARLAAARVGHLSTVDAEGRPALVPCCFALDGDTVYSPVDDKPKTTPRLARMTNVEANPHATLLVDHYAEDWTTLWWVRVRARGRTVTDDAERERAIDLLRAKYPQYATHRLEGPVLALDVVEWKAWSVRSTHG